MHPLNVQESQSCEPPFPPFPFCLLSNPRRLRQYTFMSLRARCLGLDLRRAMTPKAETGATARVTIKKIRPRELHFPCGVVARMLSA